MNILKGFERFGQFRLNTDISKSPLISFTPVNSNDNRKGSHTYLIVVNDKVKKLGCSVTKLKNFAGYGVGNGGQPSDRTTGIHYKIAHELYKGNNVDFYVQLCPTFEKVDIPNLFGETKTLFDIKIDSKRIEEFHLSTFKDTYHHLPEWNKQEAGRKNDWETPIKNIAISHKSKKDIPFDPQESDPLMLLYYWKKYGLNIFPANKL